MRCKYLRYSIDEMNTFADEGLVKPACISVLPPLQPSRVIQALARNCATNLTRIVQILPAPHQFYRHRIRLRILNNRQYKKFGLKSSTVHVVV